MNRAISASNRRKLARQCLAGLSVADAFGQQFVSQPELVFRRELPMYPWTFTDDTVMGIAVTQCLEINNQIDQDDLARRFSEAYSCDPHRGYGQTAQKILREIADGCDWKRVSSSVFGGTGSKGNGAAMRAGPIGAYFFDDLQAVSRQAKRSAEVTHWHLEGQAGSIAVAAAVALARQWFVTGRVQQNKPRLIHDVLPCVPNSDTAEGLKQAMELATSISPQDAAAELGNGSQMTASETVPFCLWAAQTFLDSYEEAMWQTVSAFGDLDTNCAIVESIVVMANGPRCLPEDWLLFSEPLNG